MLSVGIPAELKANENRVSLIPSDVKMIVDEGVPVEVEWNERFSKYQVVRVLPADTPLTTSSFFYHK